MLLLVVLESRRSQKVLKFVKGMTVGYEIKMIPDCAVLGREQFMIVNNIIRRQQLR